MKTTLTLVLLIIGTVTLARADIARPEPKPTQPSPAKHVISTGLEIVPDSKTYNARLQISEAALKELRDATSGGATTKSFGQRITGSASNTIVAGLFLFLSISFGGVWLARSSGKTRSHKAVAAILVACATVSTAAIIAQGNAGPPPSYLWRNLTKNLSTGKTTRGPIDVEIVAEGDGIKLIVPTRDASRTDD
ncbi:MAG TPA: hypothetical protein VJU84_12995 [Pyrinomonadaceae bacterium]|nr:hypothetical protein [Pyrinomonadaceae bacterium]